MTKFSGRFQLVCPGHTERENDPLFRNAPPNLSTWRAPRIKFLPEGDPSLFLPRPVFLNARARDFPRGSIVAARHFRHFSIKDSPLAGKGERGKKRKEKRETSAESNDD
jgi:hypothetical protein